MAADIILSSSVASTDGINSICLGSGRFLRSVLVPFLSSHSNTAVFQTRGRNFVDSFASVANGKEQGVCATLPTLEYPIDTKNYDGSTTAQFISICAAGTLGNSKAKSHFFEIVLPEFARSVSVIGVGVTEAGLQSRKNGTMVDLTTLLHRLYELGGGSEGEKADSSKHPRLCVINTDNVPNNGDLIRRHVLENAREFYGNEVNSADGKNAGEEGNSGNGFVRFLEHKVAFLNTMVDRITSSRPGSNGLVPLCEPLPMKALVICDEGRDLPKWMESADIKKMFGVKIRHSAKELASDIALKLRIANGTHTAVAHVMALSSLLNTDSLSNSSSSSELLLTYLDALFQTQILPASTIDDITTEETQATWKDWRQRLIHPHFGLSTFFITQNGAAKGGIRLGPSVKSLVCGSQCLGKDNPLSVSMAFAMAVILRFVTPIADCTSKSTIGQYPLVMEKIRSGIYVGWLDESTACGKSRDSIVNSYFMESSAEDTVTYADGLRYNLSQGWYEFRCDCPIKCQTSPNARSEVEMPLQEMLSKLVGSGQPRSCEQIVRSYLLHPQGGDLESLLEEDEQMVEIFDEFVCAVSTLYARMISGDKGLDLLREMAEQKHVYTNGLATSCTVLVDGEASTKQNDLQPLCYRMSPIPSSSNLIHNQKVHKKDVRSIIFSEVSSVQVIDLHTHLLPPSHGALCLWGIDELLTYHYLVAEYFMTAPADVTPQGFYALSKKDQADLIWDALFVKRSPISEATRGVITTLVGLGLDIHVKNRDLPAIREFYDSFRNDGLNGAERFCELVYQVSGVRYAVMTNIPFDSNESQHWRPKKKEYPNTFKSALRVDPLLAGDKKTIETALKSAGYGTTLADARQYLHDWCDTMKPEYMMASTPHDFSLSPSQGGGILAGVKKTGVDEKAMQSPFAFADLTGKNDCEGCEETEDMPSVINENSDFLTQVLMPVCEERDLPLALKIGAHRGVNPELRTAGDGIVAFADTESLSRLCARFPKVRFLATFLSRVNQHEACVLANKWRNLHLYGCWWYCNNPSIIHEITAMRVEMLGTAFTSQHSDARVMDQLIYKWSHSRAVIADVLAKEYEKVLNSGWCFTRAEIRRDVQRSLGGSYEEFMEKSLN